MTQELGKEETRIQKTPYDWCLIHNVRPYHPEHWDTFNGEHTYGLSFHMGLYTEEDFIKELKNIDHKVNSRPRKMDEFLEYRNKTLELN